jgi:Zn-dependent protease with chaperone function
MPATEAHTAIAATEVELGKVVARPPLSRQYKVGLCIVAIFMLLLPALYVALAAALAYGIYMFATLNSSMMDSRYAYSVALYLVPLIAGCVLVVFMLKPLAFKFWGRERGIELRRQDAPEFHAFVANIAGMLNVPPPRTIWIDMNPNAGARFRRDLFAFRSEPILIIGLPLLLELNTRQIASVIAHEICHLSQRTAMRLTWIIRTVNYWFAYAVHGPHIVEEFLNWSSELGPLSIVLYTAKLFVWIARSILKLMLMSGHSVSCYMLRQMEFDADIAAARVAGSRTFEQILPKIEASIAAGPFMHDDLEFAARNRLMPDDITLLFSANCVHAMMAGFRGAAYVKLGGYHKYMRTHPSDEERADCARREAADGLIRDESPATSIFKNFANVSKKFTVEWYRQVAGQPIKPADCFSELSRRVGKDGESAAAFERYFNLPAAIFQPIPLLEVQLSADTEPCLQQLNLARRRGIDEAAQWRRELENVRSAHDADLKARRAKAFAEYGLPADLHGEGGPQPQAQGSQHALNEFERHAAERLMLALRLLQSKRVSPAQQQYSELSINRVVDALTHLSPLMQKFIDFRADHIVSLELCSQLSTRMRITSVAKVLRPRLEATCGRLSEFQKALGKSLYPFDHYRQDLTLRRYAIPELPEKPDLRTIGISDDMLMRIFPIYFSTLSRCARLAESVEESIAIAGPTSSATS